MNAKLMTRNLRRFYGPRRRWASSFDMTDTAAWCGEVLVHHNDGGAHVFSLEVW